MYFHETKGIQWKILKSNNTNLIVKLWFPYIESILYLSWKAIGMITLSKSTKQVWSRLVTKFAWSWVTFLVQSHPLHLHEQVVCNWNVMVHPIHKGRKYEHDCRWRSACTESLICSSNKIKKLYAHVHVSALQWKHVCSGTKSHNMEKTQHN